jgi:hypothetical protein
LWDSEKEPAKPPEFDPGDGPYPPPQRNCYVCGQRCWHWNKEKESYECASGDKEHEKRKALKWIHAFSDSSKDGPQR